MADETHLADRKPSIGAELIIPISAIIFTIYYISTIIDSPWTAQVTGFFVGTILIALCLLFIAFSTKRLIRKEADLGFQRLVEPISILPQRLALFALTLGYIIVIPHIGFTLTSMVFLSAGMLVLSRGRRKRFIVSLSAILAVVWLIVFVLIFKRRFPMGWIDQQIASVVRPLLQLIGLG